MDNGTGQADMSSENLPDDEEDAELVPTENPESSGETVSSNPWHKFRFDSHGGWERRTISPHEDAKDSTDPRSADGDQP